MQSSLTSTEAPSFLDADYFCVETPACPTCGRGGLIGSTGGFGTGSGSGTGAGYGSGSKKAYDLGMGLRLGLSSLRAWYRLRYLVIHRLGRPLRCLPYHWPLLGGKSLPELLVVAGLFFVAVAQARRGLVRAGQTASALGGLAVVLGLRNNVLTVFLGISFERALSFHKLTALAMLAVLGFHVSTAFSVAVVDDDFRFVSRQTATGLVMLTLTLCIGATYALKTLVSFEAFYYAHMALYLLVLPIAAIHGAYAYAVAAALWALDLSVRYVWRLHSARATCELLPAGVVKVILPRLFSYKAGQYCFVRIPALSALEFHPFSISTAPNDRELRFHIRCLGDWTNRLRTLIQEQGKLGRYLELDVDVEGPYGISSVNLDDPSFSVFLFISGGIGVTPTQSHFNKLISDYSHYFRSVRKAIFVWSVKDRALVDGVFEAEAAMDINQRKDLPTSFQPDMLHLGPKVQRANFNSSFSISSSTHSTVLRTATSPGSVVTKSPLAAFSPSFSLSGMMSPASAGGLDTMLDVDVGSIRDISFSLRQDIHNYDPFHVEFYLTSVRTADKHSAANINTATQGATVSFERLQLSDLFHRTATLCAKEGISRVAVVVCGPPSMVAEVHSLCSHRHVVEHESVVFHLTVEEFSL